MARRRYEWTESRIAKYVREGRGRGTGSNYKPWLRVFDVPSLGKSHRVFWPKTGRVHHLLSDLEYYAFLRHCFDHRTSDIREQFPLPREDTVEIARQLGVRHPRREVILVMTTDLLVTQVTPAGRLDRAFAIKEDKELRKERTLQKLEIERLYWERRGVPWAIIPSSRLRNTHSYNLEWLFGGPSKANAKPEIDSAIRAHLADAIKDFEHLPLHAVCGVVDGRLALRAGRTLAMARRMIFEKALLVDLSLGKLPDQPAARFSVPR
ncbi:TnsA endonuclease N-terminal domain-containing protein [Bradyrhizobium sp. Bra64]|uniref:TnsA endonuclease N-terminal domain-containing protein n=1 Tax=Bradyrhizobium sp. Bra64 TaxID=2926009 RepID=UPI0021191059|nr:TnsA endonuclease N-terminal domain-containing protein [Bradyrhizobium sp. Bra64]